MTTNPGRTIRSTVTATVITFALLGCGGDGTYASEGDGIVLALKSGGKATITIGGQSQDCTYKKNGDQIAVTCPGDNEPAVFTKKGDQLEGPPGGMMAVSLKKK